MKPFAVIAILLLAVLNCPARAERVLQHYDLDSLSYLSAAIVRVEVGEATPFKTMDGDCIVHQVKVLDAFKGSMKAGDFVRVAGLDEYKHAPGIPNRADSLEPIAKGDIVYLFLAPNDGRIGYSMYHLTNADWVVIESGSRLLEEDRVYGFSQLYGKGGFAAMTQSTFPNAPRPSRRDFEDRLKQSQQIVADISRLLTAKITPKVASQIVELLRSRYQLLRTEMANDDALGPKLACRLDGVTSPEELASLLPESSGGTKQALDDILQSHWGRRYLLQRVADAAEPEDRREDFARILYDAGYAYATELAELETGQIKDVDTDFATRLAKLAVGNLNTKLGEPLLAGIANCAEGVTKKPAPLTGDLQSADRILSDAFGEASPRNQFLIAEVLMRTDEKAYHQTLPHAGPLLTFIQPDSDFDDALAHRELHALCAFRSLIHVPSDLKLVLHSDDGKPDTEITIDTQIGKDTDTFGYLFKIEAVIPNQVAGQYRVFLRDYLGDRANGDGLGFLVVIPAK